MQLSNAQITDFQTTVLAHYDRAARHELPWRQPEADGQFDAYKIWVSELMLQQTQVARVIPKYQQFLQLFPTLQVLAAAELGQVLIAWQGLGYNRRAKFLWQAAQTVVRQYAGQLPNELAQLVALPGIGHNTAGAIMAYAYNQPVLFVETNIRSVYFHHFFRNQADIDDKQIIGLLAQTLPAENAREFYWALMDYGNWLKRQGHGNITQSKHYSKQSLFAGSVRQLRGRILRLLAEQPLTRTELLTALEDDRAAAIIEQLCQEQLIRLHQRRYCLA